MDRTEWRASGSEEVRGGGRVGEGRPASDGRWARLGRGAAWVVLAGWGAAGRAQMLGSSVQVRDVPFQATQVVTRASRAGVSVTRGRMARDAAGSTYVEMVDPATGVAMTAFVLDVPGRRGIVLDLVHRRYSVRPAPELAGRELLPEMVPEELRRAAETKGRSEGTGGSGTEAAVTHLGTRLISGLMTVGQREVWRDAGGGGGKQMESWFSVELGLCVRMTETDAAGQQMVEVGLTEVMRVPPDGSLFRVPAGFVEDGTGSQPPSGSGWGPAAEGE